MLNKTIQITGTVRDTTNGNVPMPFVKVIPFDSKGNIISNYGQLTNDKGEFKLSIPLVSIPNPMLANVPIVVPIASGFRVSFSGYVSEDVKLKRGQTDYRVGMSNRNQELEAVTVSAEHPRTTCKKQGGVFNEETRICITEFPKEECEKRGGTYDERLKKCMMPPPSKKRQKKGLIIGAVVLVALVVGFTVYKTVKSKG